MGQDQKTNFNPINFSFIQIGHRLLELDKAVKKTKESCAQTDTVLEFQSGRIERLKEKVIGNQSDIGIINNTLNEKEAEIDVMWKVVQAAGEDIRELNKRVERLSKNLLLQSVVVAVLSVLLLFK